MPAPCSKFSPHSWAALLIFFWATLVNGQEKHFQSVVTSGDAPFTLDLSDVTDVTSARIEIRNNSGSPIAMPWVSVAGAMPPLNKQSIISFLKNSSVTDEDFAIASWQYVLNYSVAYCSAGSPYDTGGSTIDPVRMLYGYGMGCCDQQAIILEWLWDAAGYKTQIAVMNFHTLPEIYYGGAWHMLDPNHRVIYRLADNTIANVDQIIADPSLVANTADANGLDPVGWSAATMAQLYAANAASLHYARLTYSAPADPAFFLLPHETLELRSQSPWPNPIYYVLNPTETPLAALQFASAVFRRPGIDNGSNLQAQSINGLGTVLTQRGRSALTTVGGNDGEVVYSQAWPFPIQSLGIHGEFLVNDPSASVSVYFSSDGVSWSSPVPLPLSATIGDFRSKVDLSQFARGAYSYFVKLQFSGAQPGAIGAYSLQVNSEVQMGPQLFPQLQPGQVNTLEYRDLSPSAQTRSVEIMSVVPQGRPVIPNLTAESLIPESSDYSIALGYQAGNLVDGDTASLAYPGTNSVDYVIHLGGKFRVSAVSLWWGYFGTNPIYVSNWHLYSRSDANQPWVPIINGGFPNSALSDITLDTTATDLRITAASSNWIGLYEFKAYGDELPPFEPSSNLSVMSNVTQDPFYSLAQNYGAANLVDGSTASLAYPGSTSVDYVVGLGQRSHVDNIDIDWGVFGSNPIYVSNWSLFGRDGSGQWSVIASGGFPGAPVTSFLADHYVTDLRLTANSGLNWIGLYELGIGATSSIEPVKTSSNVPDTGAYAYPTPDLTDGDETTLAYPGSPCIDYELDFGADTYLDLVNIVWGYFGTNPIYVGKWALYGQRDGDFEWKPITGGIYPNSVRTVGSIMGTYRKIRVTANSIEGDWIGIYEIEAFGTSPRR